MPNSTVNTIAFNVGTPTIAGPNGGFINGVKFTGPSKSGKFWIAATSANAKAGSTREPNSKEKADLLAAFKTAFVAANEGVATPEGDAFVNTVVNANTPAAKPEAPKAEGGADDKGGATDAGAGDKGDTAENGSASAPPAAAEAAAETATSGEAAAKKGGDFSGEASAE